MLNKVIILLMTFVSVGILIYYFFPVFSEKWKTTHEKKAGRISNELEDMFMAINKRNIFLAISISPIVLGILGGVIFGLVGLIAGLALGFIVPTFLVKFIRARREKKFQSQLTDGLMILSHSLKGGLSFAQAIDELIEQMPPPINEEFGLVRKEHSMGVSLEEAFNHLNKRIDSEELNMLTTAVLVARETGGNLPEILENLSFTIREKIKIKEQVKTLTTQGRLQGIVMIFLPIIFAFGAYHINPEFFKLMLEDTLGRLLLFYAAISEVVGAILINKLSKVEV